jgi:hypothetical protein
MKQIPNSTPPQTQRQRDQYNKEEQEFLSYVDELVGVLKNTLQKTEQIMDKFLDRSIYDTYSDLWLFVCRHVNVFLRSYTFYNPDLYILRCHVFTSLLYHIYSFHRVNNPQYQNDYPLLEVFLADQKSN